MIIFILFVITFVCVLLIFIWILIRILTVRRYYYESPEPPPPLEIPPDVQGHQQPQVIREREITREVVKVRCRYCGSLFEETQDKCPYCGGR
jgi:hypothetical protein